MTNRIEHQTIVGWVPCPLNWGNACIRKIAIPHREVEIIGIEKHVLIEVGD